MSAELRSLASVAIWFADTCMIVKVASSLMAVRRCLRSSKVIGSMVSAMGGPQVQAEVIGRRDRRFLAGIDHDGGRRPFDEGRSPDRVIRKGVGLVDGAAQQLAVEPRFP